MATVAPERVRPWYGAMAASGREFGPVQLSLLSGTVPDGLAGSLYLNGAGRLERNGQRISHWFDGDGGVLGIHIGDRQAVGVYRYVQTAGYVAEETAGRFVWSGYDAGCDGPYWRRFGKPLKNAANTSVLALPDRLLALWEGGLPHALDLDTLQTVGLDNLDSLPVSSPYSAHPKVAPDIGEIYNFGVQLGPKTYLQIYRSDRTGRVVNKASLPLPRPCLLHDFALAGHYLVFCIPPVQLDILAVLLRRKSYCDALNWQPSLGTQVVVVDRYTLQEVSRFEAEPWFQWHVSNGYSEREGEIAVELVRYRDFATNEFLREVPSGNPQTYAKGTLWKLCIDPVAGRLLESQELCDRHCEFPQVAPAQVGLPQSQTYLSVHRSMTDGAGELLNGLACIDRESGRVEIADLGPQCYPSEARFVPYPGQCDRGWVLTVVYDAGKHQSQVWVLAGDRLSEPPVCRWAMPHPIPIGFHGTWAAQRST